jgi:hypothetical protein
MTATALAPRIEPVRRLATLLRLAATLLGAALAVVALLASSAIATPGARPSARATVQVTATVIRTAGGQETQTTAEEFIDLFEIWQQSAMVDGSGSIESLDRMLEGGLVRVSVAPVAPETDAVATGAGAGEERQILVEYVGT